MPAPHETSIYRFDAFEVRPASGELLRDGERIHLVDKSFQLLVALLDDAGDVVSREALCRRLWPPDTFVDFDNNLNAAVRRLREALGDAASNPRYVETLPRRGYRFIAPVARDGREEPPREPPPTHRATWPALGALLVVPLVLALAWLGSRPVASQPDGKLVLAVLPFVNLAAPAEEAESERDFLSDGMTEELITHLGRLNPLRLGVIARVSALSFKGSERSAVSIGRELGADFVLEGSTRSDGRRVRVVARLVQVSDDTQLWTEAYDGDMGDVLTLQADVASRVARSLSGELLHDDRRARARAATTVTAAYEAYLRGRHQWRRFTGEGYRHATAHFGQAIALDPEFAQAHAGLADAYNLLAFDGMAPTEALTRAADAARQALALDPDLAEAHNALAFTLLYNDFDPAAADRAFAEAHRLAPGYAMAYHWHAGALSALGRHDEAIAAIEHALALDPASLSVRSDVGWYYLYADRFTEGLAVCEDALRLDPHYGWAQACRNLALEHLGDLGTRLEHARRDAVDDPEQATALAGDDPAAALAGLHRLRLERTLAGDDPPPLKLAMLHAAVGEIDTAFAQLEQALVERDGWLVFLRVDPRFDPLHDDPRFEGFCQRVGV